MLGGIAVATAIKNPATTAESSTVAAAQSQYCWNFPVLSGMFYPQVLCGLENKTLTNSIIVGISHFCCRCFGSFVGWKITPWQGCSRRQKQVSVQSQSDCGSHKINLFLSRDAKTSQSADANFSQPVLFFLAKHAKTLPVCPCY